jgi:uncharacterized protein
VSALEDGPLDWMLTDFARSAPGVVHALVVSSDGLCLAATPGVDPALADQLAAASSGLASLARGTATLLDALPVGQTILEMAGGYLFVTAIGESSLLAVSTERTADLGLVGYEMTMIASRVGHALTPAVRSDRTGSAW